MARSFLSRLSSSVTWGFLQAPCLLLCLACATPFPIENLREGMTTEAVREEFGAPDATEADLGEDAKSCWTYWHEGALWFLYPPSPFFLPALMATLVFIPWSGGPWDTMWVYREPVLLDFEEEELVRWKAITTIVTGYDHTLSPLGGSQAFSPPGGMHQSITNVAHWPDPPTCASIRELEFRRVR